jgi:hypothetical protein
VEYRDGQAFEITYTTEKSAIEYWDSHKDDCFGLWEVAKILYDKDGSIKRLEDFAKEIIKKGKDPLDEIKIKHLKFDAEDSLGAIKVFAQNDIVMANFLLSKKMFDLTELFFDIRQMWLPAPKQRLSKIKDISQEFYNLLYNFYKEGIFVGEKMELFEKAIPLVFNHLEVSPPSCCVHKTPPETSSTHHLKLT